MLWTVHLEGGPRKVNHAAALVGDKIYSFGGYSSSENFDNLGPISVHVLDTLNHRWELVDHRADNLKENDIPPQRYGHTVVEYKDKIYMWGGRNNTVAFYTLYCFDPSTAQWSRPAVKGNSPNEKDGHSACVVGNKMYIFGGYDSYNDEYSQDVHALNLETFVWSRIYPKGQPPWCRDFHSATAVGSRMYVFGGRCRSSICEIYCSNMIYLDTETNTWEHPDAAGDVPVGRRSHSAWLYRDKIFIFGGYNSITEQHFNELYTYCTKTAKWTLLNVGGKVPCKRRRQCCILQQEKAFLFGGTRPRPDLNLEDLMDHSDLHVLDLSPSLKTLCIMTITNHQINTDELPKDILLDIEWMTSPNQITRPLNQLG